MTSMKSKLVILIVAYIRSYWQKYNSYIQNIVPCLLTICNSDQSKFLLFIFIYIEYNHGTLMAYGKKFWQKCFFEVLTKLFGEFNAQNIITSVKLILK